VKIYVSYAETFLTAPSRKNRDLHVQPYYAPSDLRKALVTAGIAALAAPIIVSIMHAPAL